MIFHGDDMGSSLIIIDDNWWTYGGFHNHGGNHLSLDGRNFMEKIQQKLDENWGYPFFRKPLYFARSGDVWCFFASNTFDNLEEPHHQIPPSPQRCQRLLTIMSSGMVAAVVKGQQLSIPPLPLFPCNLDEGVAATWPLGSWGLGKNWETCGASWPERCLDAVTPQMTRPRTNRKLVWTWEKNGFRRWLSMKTHHQMSSVQNPNFVYS